MLALEDFEPLSIGEFQQLKLNAPTYQAEYFELFYEVVVDRIFKHFNVDPQDTEIGFNYFAKENGKWFVSFYEPEALATIDDILDNDYSSLKELSNW